MTSPTYEYIKGEGWVPLNCETLTFELGNYRIILMARKPQPHERWFAEPKGTTLAKIAEILKGQEWRLRYIENHMGNQFSDNGWAEKLLDSDGYTWVTLRYERINR